MTAIQPPGATSGPAASGGAVAVSSRGYPLMAGLLVVTMLGGTLPIPLYVQHAQRQLVLPGRTGRRGRAL
jgi:hypothetical protein